LSLPLCPVPLVLSVSVERSYLCPMPPPSSLVRCSLASHVVPSRKNAQITHLFLPSSRTTLPPSRLPASSPPVLLPAHCNFLVPFVISSSFLALSLYTVRLLTPSSSGVVSPSPSPNSYCIPNCHPPHAYKHTHIHTRTTTHINNHMGNHIRTHTHTHMPTHILTQIDTHTHTHTHTYTYTCIHTNTLTYTHTYIHTHIHKRIHTHTHLHTPLRTVART
jgi:hypothetical protein